MDSLLEGPVKLRLIPGSQPHETRVNAFLRPAVAHLISLLAYEYRMPKWQVMEQLLIPALAEQFAVLDKNTEALDIIKAVMAEAENPEEANA